MLRQRLTALTLAALVGALVLEGRLVDLQGIRSWKFREAATRTRPALELISPPRGEILDRHGAPLAMNRRVFDAYVRLGTWEKAGRDLATLVEATGQEARVVAERVARHRSRAERICRKFPERDRSRLLRRELDQPVRIARGLSLERVIEIENRADQWPGLRAEERTARDYPAGEAVSHVVGYVSAYRSNPSLYEKREKEGTFAEEIVPIVGDLLYRSLERSEYFLDEPFGVSGLERDYHGVLEGHRGAILLEKDLFGRFAQTVSHQAPVPGRSLRLAIDLGWQRKACELLSGRAGAAIVMEVSSGELYVLASSPSYHPQKLTRDVLQNSAAPLVNRAAHVGYPLGSIFKLVTAASALEAAAIDTATMLSCAGPLDPAHPDRFRCWIHVEHQQGHGPLAVREAIQRSCNSFFFQVGRRVGLDALVGWAERFGFGRATGVEIAGEKPGLLPAVAAGSPVEARAGRSEALNLAVGQGRLLATPLQVACLVAALANGGKVPVPKLVLDPTAARDEPRQVPLSAQTRQVLLEGMIAVVHAADGGTAYATRLKEFRAAGKTSTAEAPPSATGTGPHAWFAGFAPYDRPRWVVVVLVEHGGKGSAAAAPIAADLLEEIFRGGA